MHFQPLTDPSYAFGDTIVPKLNELPIFPYAMSWAIEVMGTLYLQINKMAFWDPTTMSNKPPHIEHWYVTYTFLTHENHSHS